MRVVFSLLAIIIVLCWLGFELRERERAVSRVLFAFAGVFAVMLIGAFFGVF